MHANQYQQLHAAAGCCSLDKSCFFHWPRCLSKAFSPCHCMSSRVSSPCSDCFAWQSVELLRLISADHTHQRQQLNRLPSQALPARPAPLRLWMTGTFASESQAWFQPSNSNYESSILDPHTCRGHRTALLHPSLAILTTAGQQNNKQAPQSTVAGPSRAATARSCAMVLCLQHGGSAPQRLPRQYNTLPAAS